MRCKIVSAGTLRHRVISPLDGGAARVQRVGAVDPRQSRTKTAKERIPVRDARFMGHLV